MPDSRLRSGIAIANLRAMPTLSIVFGLILEAMGIGAYFLSGAQSVTALIPSFFGSLILLSGVVGLLIPKARMHVMHLAALVGLLGTLGGLGMGLPKISGLIAGTLERPTADHANRDGRGVPRVSRLVREVVCGRADFEKI